MNIYNILYKNIYLHSVFFKAITKWINFGTCLVPQEKVRQSTIEYSLRWILANYENQNNLSRIGFLLDWLTGNLLKSIHTWK